MTGSDRYDVVIVGAGIAGLSLAALLAKDGRRVLVLEAIHYPGGCASSYEEHGAWFDVGATTVSGTDTGQPLRMLFDEIGPFDGLLACLPTVSVQIGARRLDLTSDRRLWYDRLTSFFSQDQRRFWDEVFSVTDGIYHALPDAPFLPPLSLRECAEDLRAMNKDLFRSVPWMFRSVRSRMRHHRLDHGEFLRFVDAQLLITNQVHSDESLMLSGAPGLSFANASVSSVRGGMITLARFLEERARALGAEIAYSRKVTAIERDGAAWRVVAGGGSSVMAVDVVTQIPVFNLPRLTSGKVRKHFEEVVARVQHSGVRLWGAVTCAAIIPDTLPRNFPTNLQILLSQPLSEVGSDTLFLSFSHEFDHARVPQGFRTLSVNMHIRPERFEAAGDGAAYTAWKERVTSDVLESIRRSVPELADLRTEYCELATPRTYRRYTGRSQGLVGGIPLSRAIFPWKYPKSVTPFRGLYAIGDTFFPGQGLPGVVLGALALRRRMARMERTQ